MFHKPNLVYVVLKYTILLSLHFAKIQSGLGRGFQTIAPNFAFLTCKSLKLYFFAFFFFFLPFLLFKHTWPMGMVEGLSEVEKKSPREVRRGYEPHGEGPEVRRVVHIRLMIYPLNTTKMLKKGQKWAEKQRIYFPVPLAKRKLGLNNVLSLQIHRKNTKDLNFQWWLMKHSKCQSLP